MSSAARPCITRFAPRRHRGEVAEWSIAPHSKCGILARVSGVRISPSPPPSNPLILLFFLSFDAANWPDISAACGGPIAVVVSGDVFLAESAPLSRPCLPAGFRRYQSQGRPGLGVSQTACCPVGWSGARKEGAHSGPGVGSPSVSARSLHRRWIGRSGAMPRVREQMNVKEGAKHPQNGSHDQASGTIATGWTSHVPRQPASMVSRPLLMPPAVLDPLPRLR